MRIISLCSIVALLICGAASARDVVPRSAPPERVDLPVPASPGSSALNAYQSGRLRAYLNGTPAPLDTLRLLAVPVEFADSLMGGRQGSNRPELRDSLFFSNELKHLRDYYLGASRGAFHVVWDLRGPVIRLPEGMGYYGDDAFESERVIEMVETIIDSIDGAVDFSRYRTVFVIHAGAGQETDSGDNSRNQIWSSFYDLGDIEAAFPDSSVAGLATDDSLGGVPFFVDNFIVAPADAGQDGTLIGTLGIWAFEVGSRIGLLPLSDSTPAGFPDSRGAGNFCLMAYGLYSAIAFIPTYPCVFNRILAGWIDPLEVTRDGQFRLKDINSAAPGDTACLKIPVNEGEYFLVVNRAHDSNFDSLFTFVNLDENCFVPGNADSLGGAEFDFFMTDQTNPYTIGIDPGCPDAPKRFVSTGSGIYIWHVDERAIQQNLAAGFLPNDFVHHKGVDLEEADGIPDLDTAGGAISLGGYFDSFRAGHNDRFTPDRVPSSASNGGARTGISIDGITEPAPYMRLHVSFSSPYEETIAVWSAAGAGQPPTPEDLDGDGALEIIVLAGDGVYAFGADGLEFDDKDGDPSTIAPYIEAPGVRWNGPAALGDIDGITGPEIVAASVDGLLYAWKWDGTEVADGDGDPATEGILFAGDPLVAPPMLVDVDANPGLDVGIVTYRSDSLTIAFVNHNGEIVEPPFAAYQHLWPARLQAQACAALSFGACGNEGHSTEGVVAAWADTLGNRSGLSYIPVVERDVLIRSAVTAAPAAPASSPPQADGGWEIEFDRAPMSPEELIALLPPAIGDLDLDGFDEVAVVFPEGRLVIYDPSPAAGSAGETIAAELRAGNPSAPSLGDIDRNGTLEIVLWDSDYFYVYTCGGRLLTDWPQPKYPRLGIERPPDTSHESPAAPLIGDIDGDGMIEALFAGREGVMYAFDASGDPLRDFPRPVPAGISGTPALAAFGEGGELSVVLAGYFTSLLQRDAVSDTFITRDAMALALQTLPGTGPGSVLFWSSHRNGGARRGRAAPAFSPPAKSALAEENTFIIYPNPVLGSGMNVRIIINEQAAVSLAVYTLEGEDAFVREFGSVNQGGIAEYVFDERVDVGSLKSGLYFARIEIRGSSDSNVMVKPFAIKR